MILSIISELKIYGSPERAKHSLRFFKTEKGQYGHGDIFYGTSVPEMHIVAKKYQDISLDEIQKLLENKYHECRLVALLILVEKFESAKAESERKKYYGFYLENTRYINNWDLVDLSAYKIVGSYLYEYKKDRKILYKLANSKDLWEKRIAIISTFYFIREKDLTDALEIAKILLKDKHDLIHKAVGWMLREIGKRDQSAEEKFLQKYHKTMPRTMLRYAIEKFDTKKKEEYMRK